MFYKILRVVGRFFFYIFVGKTKVVGKENMKLIDGQPAIICANHKSNWDPIILADAFPRQIHFMAKKELFKNPVLAKILIWAGTFPVERDSNAFTAIRNAMKVLKSGKLLGIFPEGKRSNDGYVHEFKDGMPLIAYKMKAVVLPVGITNRVGLWKRPVVSVGKPVDFTEYFNKKADAQLFTQMSKIVHSEVSKLAYPQEVK